MKADCGSVTRSSGFLRCWEDSKVNLATIHTYSRSEPSLVRVYANKPRRITRLWDMPISRVFSLCANPKIGSSIIKSVTIDVINDLAGFGVRDKPMKIYPSVPD